MFFSASRLLRGPHLGCPFACCWIDEDQKRRQPCIFGPCAIRPMVVDFPNNPGGNDANSVISHAVASPERPLKTAMNGTCK